MADFKLNQYVQYGTAAARAAYTPSPPAGVQTLYLWYETDTGILQAWDGSVWEAVGGIGLPLLTADPSSPANDTWWAVRTGTSPTMQVSVKARIAGVTYTIASITI